MLAAEPIAVVTWRDQRDQFLSWAAASPARRRLWLGSVAGVIAIAAGWMITRLPSRFCAEASFECRAIPTAQVDSAGSPFVRDDMLNRYLRDASESCGSPSAVQLSIGHSETVDGSHRICIRTIDQDPKTAQELAVALARSIAARMKDSDELVRAYDDLARAEAAFQLADRAWAAALERAPADKLDALDSRPSRPVEADLQTKLESVLDYCRQERERIAAIYTHQHPAVVQLDRQIQILEREQNHCASPIGVVASPPAKDDLRLVSADTVTGESDASKRAQDVRSSALASLSLAQSRFESVAKTHPCVRYSEVAAGPAPIRELGPHRTRLFLLVTGATLVLLFGVEYCLSRRLRASSHPATAAQGDVALPS